MTDFKLVNIVDSQLQDITDELTLPVITGSSSNNYQTFNSQAGVGQSQIQFNVQIPSLQTAVSRHFLVQVDIELQINFTGAGANATFANDATVFNYGSTNALQAFPLNSLLSTVQSNLNNATVSVNSRDVLAGLLKMYNYEELAKYNSLTPSLVDSFYYNYADGLASNNNVLGNYSIGSFDKCFQPRGVFNAQLFALDGTPINSLQINASATGQAPAGCLLRFTTTEPLLFLSPYISGHSNNKSAFLGLNNLTITMNLGDANRIMSNASYAMNQAGTASIPTISNVLFKSYSNAKLLLNFLTIPPVLYSKIEPKNIVNYNQYTSYNYSVGSAIAPKATTTMSFNNIQLNQIPSKILIFARKSNLNTYDSNSFMVIKNVSINFCNKSGLLSSATQPQLYDMSVRNGLQMNYYEFSGSGISNNIDGVPTAVATIGSILCIDPALDLSIDTQYSNMSAGQYNMQFDLQLYNQTSEQITPTLYLVVVNSGVLTCENGTSSFNTGLLTQEMVLETKSKEAVLDSHTYHDEIIGGSIENQNCIHKHLKNRFSKVSEKEHQLDNEKGETIGSAMSSGSMSGGQSKRRIHRFTK